MESRTRVVSDASFPARCKKAANVRRALLLSSVILTVLSEGEKKRVRKGSEEEAVLAI
jgi:hypothetical protein